MPRLLQRDEATDELRRLNIAEAHIQPTLDDAVQKSPEPSVSVVYQISVRFDRDTQCFEITDNGDKRAR